MEVIVFCYLKISLKIHYTINTCIVIKLFVLIMGATPLYPLLCAKSPNLYMSTLKLSSFEITKVTEKLIIQQVILLKRDLIEYTCVWQFCLYRMGEYYMRVGCQYERVRYSGWYNFMWNDPRISMWYIDICSRMNA